MAGSVRPDRPPANGRQAVGCGEGRDQGLARARAGSAPVVANDRAAQVADLSEKLVRVAELLETAERLAGEVHDELEQLDLTDCVTEDFAELVIPSGAAERLQDALDQLAGELANRSLRPAPGGNETAGGVDRDAGLLRPADPPEREELRVRCPSCSRDFTSPVAGDAQQAASVSIDQRTYTCPHCGHTDRYETWDHFLA